MSEPKLFQNRNNRFLSYFILAALIVMPCITLYFELIHDSKYIELKESIVIDAHKVNELDLTTSKYVTIHNFCIDDEHYWYKSDNTDSDITSYYFFLNNQCENKNTPIIIMEMSGDIYENFANETDSLSVVSKIYSGRLYKGINTKYSGSYDLKKNLEHNDVYTFRAGVTPKMAKKNNRKTILNVLGIGLIYILMFSGVIFFNQRSVIAAYRKKMRNNTTQTT